MDQFPNPYASPQAIVPSFPPAGGKFDDRYAMPYASGHTRATAAIALLSLSAVKHLAAAGVHWHAISAIQEWAHNSQFRSAVDIKRLTSLLASTGFLVWLGTATAVLMWVHRAYRNLPALGARDMAYSPGWAVGWWFIPFLNLVRPYQVVREI